MVETLVPGGGGLRSLLSSVSKVDLASFSATMFLTTLWPRNFTLQVGQLRTSGFPLQSSQMTWPLLHWKIFLGGFISSRQTGHSSRSRTRVWSGEGGWVLVSAVSAQSTSLPCLLLSAAMSELGIFLLME